MITAYRMFKKRSINKYDDGVFKIMEDNLKGKKLLIVGGVAQHCKVVEAAKKLGVITYVVDYLPYKKAPAKQIADHYYMNNVTDVDEIVKKCKRDKIDGAISVCLDACQRPYQKICERMGFHCFGTKEQFDILTDKIKFKENCRKFGVPTIPDYTEEQIVADTNVEYPVLVKPSYSRGSRGQTICNDKNSTLNAILLAKSESTDGKAIIEKYMGRKDDFTVSLLFIDGEGFLTRTADRYVGAFEDKMEKVCIAAVSPSKHLTTYLNNAHEPLINMIKGIGIKNAPVFFQGFIDGNNVRFYDPGLRFAGGEHERFYKHAYGIDLMECLIEYALTGKINNATKNKLDPTAKLNGYYAVNLQTAVRQGVIAQIKGLDYIKSKDSVIAVFPRHRVGDVVKETYDVNQRFAEIDVIDKSAKKIKEEVIDIQNNLKVIDKEGNDMIFAKFDANVIDEYE